jgi:ribose transport system permease protein
MAAIASPAPTGSGPQAFLRAHGWAVGVYVLLVALLLLARGVHSSFGSYDIQSLALGALPLVLAAAAQTVVVIGGGIDLSIGAQMAVWNVVAARFMDGRSFGTAVALSVGILLAGAVAGSINGLLVTISRVPDIIVTLATSFVFGGLALYVLGQPGGSAPATFTAIAGGQTVSAWVPNALIAAVVCLVVIWVPLRRTRLVLAIYAIGSDRTAAFRSGVDVARTRIAAYFIAGVFSALGGLSLTATTGIGDPLAGSLYTLLGVSAIVLGGVSLAGGRGGLMGPVAAAFVLTLLPTVLIFMGIDSNYSQVIQGAMLVLVVMAGGLATLRRRPT